MFEQTPPSVEAEWAPVITNPPGVKATATHGSGGCSAAMTSTGACEAVWSERTARIADGLDPDAANRLLAGAARVAWPVRRRYHRLGVGDLLCYMLLAMWAMFVCWSPSGSWRCGGPSSGH